MKRYFLLVMLMLGAAVSPAQTTKVKDVFAFRITDYIVKLSDSVVIVQVDLPQGQSGIAEKQPGLLRGNHSNGDTATIGAGKCDLIKGSYYYFGIHLADKKKLPQKGDLIYTRAGYPATYKGQIYHLLRFDIHLQHVTEGAFYSVAFPVLGDKHQEAGVIDSLVADIKYTGREMLKQNDGQDRLITKGRFRDKKLFAAMQQITAVDVTDFLDYVIARPVMYAGNDWKIAEIFATWMDGGTPAVVKE